MTNQIARIGPDGLHPRVAQSIDKVLSVQRPIVLAHIRSIRNSKPDASPAQVITILERRFLTAVTGGGALVGATSAIPAVGVATSLVLSGVETAGFLEASALFAQSVTEVHGIAVVEPERARTLVMAMMLGSGGQELLQQFATEAAGRGSRSAYWGEVVAKKLPRAALGPLTDRVRAAFLRRFAVTQGTSVVGRAIPFGVGAVFGGVGNNILGRRIVRSARGAFPAAPDTFPATLDAAPRAPKIAKTARPARSARPAKAAKPLRRLGPRLPSPTPQPAASPAPPAPPAPEDRRPD
ncbi:MAG TPA: hypothetical protein VGM38_00020 [Pseudolysinimonas sp.]|jgi:hypothetical protein